MQDMVPCSGKEATAFLLLSSPLPSSPPFLPLIKVLWLLFGIWCHPHIAHTCQDQPLHSVPSQCLLFFYLLALCYIFQLFLTAIRSLNCDYLCLRGAGVKHEHACNTHALIPNCFILSYLCIQMFSDIFLQPADSVITNRLDVSRTDCHESMWQEPYSRKAKYTLWSTVPVCLSPAQPLTCAENLPRTR